MSERPVRWLEDASAGARERELLRSAPSGEPAAEAEDRIWALLATRLPPDPGPSGGDGGIGDGGAGAGVAAGAGAITAFKAGAIGALAGLVVASAAVIAEPAPAPPERPAPAALAVEPASEPAAITEPNLPATLDTARESAPQVALDPAPAHSADPPALTAPSVGTLQPEEPGETQLREESQALQAVRTALRRGDAAGALATLEATRARFPASVLGQEREALTIQALARAGQADAARSRARAFIAKYPSSPHAATLARFVEPSPTK